MRVDALIENHRAIAAKKYAILEHQPQGAGEDHLFHVVPGLREVVCRVRVIHRDDLLHDDRAFVELFGDKVRGRANHLDAAIKRLLIGPARR